MLGQCNARGLGKQSSHGHALWLELLGERVELAGGDCVGNPELWHLHRACQSRFTSCWCRLTGQHADQHTTVILCGPS